MFFDSHCHLDFQAYDGKRVELWSAVQQEGLTGLIIPGVEPAQWTRLPSLCADLNTVSVAGGGVHHAVGLHPWWISNAHTVADIVVALRLAGKDAVAIGETGLDQTRHAKHVTLARQRTFLEAHIALANDVGLPLILHCVAAHEPMLEVLRDNRPTAGGVVHSFSGSLETAEQYIELGMHISFSCAALRFGKKKRAAVACVPDERLLVETDAPDQSAGRDRHGSPLDVIEVAKYVAEARGSDLTSIARITRANASALFRL